MSLISFDLGISPLKTAGLTKVTPCFLRQFEKKASRITF